MLAHAPPPRILFIEPSTHHYLYCAPRIRRSAVHITIRHTFLPPSTIITRKALRHSLHQIFVDQIRSKIEKRVRYLAKLLYAPRSHQESWCGWLGCCWSVMLYIGITPQLFILFIWVALRCTCDLISIVRHKEILWSAHCVHRQVLFVLSCDSANTQLFAWFNAHSKFSSL